MSYVDKIYLNQMITSAIANSYSQKEAMVRFNCKLVDCLSAYVELNKIQEGSEAMDYIRNTFVPLAKQYAKSSISKMIVI